MTVLSRILGIIGKSTLEIIPNVYQLTLRDANIILIIEEELTIVDTGLPGSSTRIVDFICSLGRSVAETSLIIITHNHFDHAGGLAELRKLTKAKVVAHQADISDTEGQLPYPGVVRRLLRVSLFSSLRPALLVSPDNVDIQLTGGEVLKPLGGLKVVHTPGHTPGSISLFSPQNKLLIVADALSERSSNPCLPHKMVGTDFRQAIDSVKEIARLDFDILCFGHGGPLIGDVRSKMQDLVDKIKD